MHDELNVIMRNIDTIRDDEGNQLKYSEEGKDKYKELMNYFTGGLVVGGAGTLIKDNLVGGRKRRRTKRKSRRRRHSRVSRTRYSSKRKSRKRSRRRSRRSRSTCLAWVTRW